MFQLKQKRNEIFLFYVWTLLKYNISHKSSWRGLFNGKVFENVDWKYYHIIFKSIISFHRYHIFLFKLLVNCPFSTRQMKRVISIISIIEYTIYFMTSQFIEIIFFNNNTRFSFVYMRLRIEMLWFIFNINCFTTFITIP